MKKIFIGLSVVVVMIAALAGCNSDMTTYNGPDYIMFSDTLYSYPVEDNDEYFDVPVSATQACDYDRTFGVEVIDKGSNAIEGVHYKLQSNTVTIKAGERATNVKVHGIYDNIGETDSLGFALRLVNKEEMHWKMYGIDSKVVMYKSCPFDLHNFTGYCVVTSTYMREFMNNLDARLIESTIDPENENTIILKDFFYDGYDVKLKFKPGDPTKPFVEMEDQVFASTADAFGTLYGKGNIMVYQPSIYTCYFNTCQKFVFQYMTLHVPGMPAGQDVVGTFVNVIEWISDDEAEKMKREGY